ncbi:hypothetical protein R6Q57_001900 [Mikania cordata]
MVVIDLLTGIPISFLRVVSLEYFDLDSLRNTNQQEGISFRIHAECQRAYKDLKQEFKKHFDSDGGYEDVEREIMQEEFKRYSQESGDLELVNQIEVMERALGQRRGLVRGVCHVVRHPTPDVSSTYPPQQR